MDFDRSKHNVIKYLPTNNDENIWGMSISGIGFQSIDPKGSYPLKGHPIGYTFNPDRGRIIDEFALVYIVKGEGTFTSINCFEKKISKGEINYGKNEIRADSLLWPGLLRLPVGGPRFGK